MNKEKEKNRKLSSSFSVIRRLLVYYKPYKGLLMIIFAFFVVDNGLYLARPKLLGHIINQIVAIAKLDTPVYENLLVFTGIYLAIAVLGSIAFFLFGVWRTRLQQNILMDMRTAIFDKIQRLSYSYHDENHSGTLITRATRDVDHMRIFFGQVVFQMVEFLFLIFGAMAIIVWINLKLALVSFVLLPFASGIIVYAAKKLRVLFKEADDEYDNVTKVLQESISGIRVVKAFGREPGEIDKFNTNVSKFFKKIVYSVDYFAFFIPFSNNVFAMSIPAVLGYGGYMVSTGVIQIGDLAACIFYLTTITRHMRMLGRIVDRTQNAVASADRINQILDAKESIQSAGEKKIPKPKGEVTFNNVWFAYGKEKPVFKGIRFTIQPGETVAFVGPTGSGKTTACLLIPRFYDITDGSIALDGVDIRERDLHSLRSEVGMVFQESFLFSATIAENIAFGRPDAGMEDIKKAAGAAQIAGFVESLEKGYDTLVGERGINLSGGQKQRLTIARAIIMNPLVLILDDCTSAVDAVTERELRSTIESVAENRTTIIVAQRISTVRTADRIIVFSEGRIVQEGNHDELINMEGTYRSIFYSQTFERMDTRRIKRQRPATCG